MALVKIFTYLLLDHFRQFWSFYEIFLVESNHDRSVTKQKKIVTKQLYQHSRDQRFKQVYCHMDIGTLIADTKPFLLPSIKNLGKPTDFLALETWHTASRAERVWEIWDRAGPSSVSALFAGHRAELIFYSYINCIESIYFWFFFFNILRNLWENFKSLLGT